MSIRIRNAIAWVVMAVAVAIVCAAIYVARGVKDENIARYNRMSVVRDLLASDSIAIIILSPDGHIVEWSPGATVLFDWTAPEVMGSYPNFLMTDDCWKMHKEGILASNVLSAEQTRRITSIDAWAFGKSRRPIAVHIIAGSFKNHIGYYHIAVISASEDYRRLPMMEKPAEDIVLPDPAPMPVGRMHGVYYDAFQE